MSAHGSLFNIGAPFHPCIGDEANNWLDLRDYGRGDPSLIGARAGIIWDVCNSGRPRFRELINPHLAHEITHVDVRGVVRYADSVHIASTIFTSLLTPETLNITPDAVAAAAELAKPAIEYCTLVHTRLGSRRPDEAAVPGR